MHILFLTDNFPPEVNAPASRTFEHCREWVRLGHEVTVITCAPNFPKGKVYDGYRNKIWQTEVMEGIRVIRVWSYITANEGFVKRILDYQSYMVSATIASVFVRKPGLIVSTSPQFFTACCGVVVSGLKRIPFVFELRDIWPESVKAVGAMDDSALIRLLEKIEMFLYRKADLIVSVTNSFKKTLVKRGIDGSKIQVVTNGVDVSRYTPRDKDVELLKQLNLEDKFVAGYIGTHGMAHKLDFIIECAKKIENEEVHFLFIGHGSEKMTLMKLVKDEKILNVTMLDSMPKLKLLKYLSILDVAIINLKKDDLFKTVIPSKIFENAAMQIPILIGVDGEARKIVENYNAGLFYKPENEMDFIGKVNYMIENKLKMEKFKKGGETLSIAYDRIKLAKKMLLIIKD